MTSHFTESLVEEAALSWFEEVGYSVLHGPLIAPDEPQAERASYSDVILLDRLRSALSRINPAIPTEALEEAIRKVGKISSPIQVVNNRNFHQLLVNGVDIEYKADDGRILYDKAWLVDYSELGNNDWLVVNQFTVVEGKANRRPDMVVFVNGLPLAVVELKNLADENTTIIHAFNQLQTYKKEIPCLFPFNELLIISDGMEARVGSITSNLERFMPWRTIEGKEIAPRHTPQLEVLIRGIFAPSRLLDLIRHFIVFESTETGYLKKIAGYHQYHAVNKAVVSTIQASSPKGDKRVGVIWHTQGSGKSLTMTFYAGKIILHDQMANPTLVLLTDRNDLDNQLFATFSACEDLLRQKPVQAEDRSHLRKLLQVASGGVIFTTIQKFLPDKKGDTIPQLSDRRNIVVIADEAHRSQYDFIDGFARHLRDALLNASFIGFTGTPIEATDKNTKAVFGNYIDVYDIQRAVDDGATVRIYYEGRLAKIELREEEKPKIDPGFEEVTEGEEQQVKEKLKSKWARLEQLVGSEKRIALVARDLVDHFEKRMEAMEGKGLIVCMSRRICVDLYNAIIKLRPHWHNDEEEKGVIKVVMTGSASDPLDWQGHIRSKRGRDDMAKRFKDPKDPLKLVIVRDMWLTGFDVPCLHTMYLDKPMTGHNLMQAIARVNRVFREKPGGLVVDYLGLADQLKQALADYTSGGGAGEPTLDQEQAVAVMKEKYEVVRGIFHGFDYLACLKGTPAEKMSGVAKAMDFILREESEDQYKTPEKPEERKNRFLKAVTELSKAFALSVPHEEALKIRDELAFFQAVRAGMVKATVVEGSKADTELDTAIRQLVSQAVMSNEVVDIFRAAGLKTPDISILSDEFLAEVKNLPHKNLALELLRKLLNDEIKLRAKTFLVQSRSFSEMLEQSIRKYQNRAISAAQVISELIELAKHLREAHKRGEDLKLTNDELAFYDALEVNDSAVKVLGDDALRTIARELVDTVRKNVTIDWTVKENVRAKLRTLVKRILRKYGYPPDKQEKATQTVLAQAELLCKDWAA